MIHNSPEYKQWEIASLQQIADKYANIPLEPQVTEEQAENNISHLDLARMDVATWSAEAASFFSKDAVDKRIDYYKQAIADHRSRAFNVNLVLDDIAVSARPIAVAKICEKSNYVLVADTAGDMLKQHAETLKKFIDEGRTLMILTSNDKHVLEPHDNLILATIDTEQINQLHQSDIRSVILGDGNSGCFQWEKCTKSDIHSENVAFKDILGMVGEQLGNLFRKQPVFDKYNNVNAAQDNLLQHYKMSTSFCHHQEVKRLTNIVCAVLN